MLINLASFSDSTFINKIFFFIASLSSVSLFPTPENTILLGFIPAFKTFNNSPAETTSAPHCCSFKTFKIDKFELDFTEKQTRGFDCKKVFLKFFKFSKICFFEYK